MITLDSSIIPAIIIFLTLIVALNYLLFRPLLQVQADRESRTTGLIAQAQKRLDHHHELFDQYQATIKRARIDGYKRHEQLRSEAVVKRSEALAQARKSSEQLIAEARESIQNQVQAARIQLNREVQEMAQIIVAAIMQRPA